MGNTQEQPQKLPSQEKMNEIRKRLYGNKQQGFRPAKKPSYQKIISFEQQQKPFVKDRNEKIKNRQKDSRKLVNDPLEYPYSAIGLLTFKQQIGQYSFIGTGFLVGKNIVMTCAHNLYSRAKKKRSVELVFWPGRNGLKGNYYKAKNFYYPEQYQKSQIGKEQQFDFGVIQLEDSIGSIYGYLGLNFMGQKQGEAELAGYPLLIYNEKGEKVKADKKMYTDKGQFIKISQSEGRIRYIMGTSGGQSGSPIFIKENEEFYVVGVHTDNGKGGENEGVLLDQKKKIRIGKWIWSLGQQVDLSAMKLEEEEIRELLKREKQTIEKKSSINLDWNNIGAEGAKHLASGNLKNLTTLDLQYNYICAEGAKHLASGNLTNLTTLDLKSNYICAEGVKHLALGNLTNLTTLDLKSNYICAEGVKHLASGNLTKLTNLNLDSNKIGDEGAKHLASGNLTNLATLNLKQNNIGAEGAKHLASGNLTKLINLNLESNYICAEGAKHLVSGNLTNLATLNLQYNNIGAQGVKHLASGNLANLSTLNLYLNNIGDQGTKHLASGNLTNLITLNLSNNSVIQIIITSVLKEPSIWLQAISPISPLLIYSNYIGDQGTKHLASGNLANLSTLNLYLNNIGAEGAKHLSSGNLTKLNILNLNFNKIGDQGAKHLALGNLANLTTLNLYKNNIGAEGTKHLSSGNLTNLSTLHLYQYKINPKFLQIEINLLKSNVENVII